MDQIETEEYRANEAKEFDKVVAKVLKTYEAIVFEENDESEEMRK